AGDEAPASAFCENASAPSPRWRRTARQMARFLEGCIRKLLCKRGIETIGKSGERVVLIEFLRSGVLHRHLLSGAGEKARSVPNDPRGLKARRRFDLAVSDSLARTERCARRFVAAAHALRSSR